LSADAPLMQEGKHSLLTFRLFHGITASGWARLLAQHRYAISPSRLPLVLQMSMSSVVSSALSSIQDLVFSDRIAASTIDVPPIFILGHWRTGTTYLHELIALNDAFCAPTSLECGTPGHFLVSGSLVRFLSFMLPAKRPMDDMQVGFDRPQEDEIALVNLGFRSPFESMIFPNHRPAGNEFLNIGDLAPDQRERWKAGLLRFLQSVNLRCRREMPDRDRRMVLKSPPHTARIPTLREMFPQAQFIHTVRHPYEVFASTMRLMRVMYGFIGVQEPVLGPLPGGGPSLEEYVIDTMDLLYRDFFAEAAMLPPGRLSQVRYEDLASRPIDEVGRLYRELGLGSIEPIRPKLEAHLASIKEYKPNQLPISDEHKALVNDRWCWYFDRFGYQAS
jgi:omega-hydroxy-beta-dihydromenaquinone-9 sulfotransferase